MTRRAATVSHVSPNQPKTPIHAVRVPPELWQAARAAARKRGETVSDVIRRALTEYVAEDGPRLWTKQGPDGAWLPRDQQPTAEEEK